MSEMTPELQARAERELNEDPRRTEADVRHLQDWLAKQPHLKARPDSAWLVSFLRGCKFSLERTKERLDNYHTLRAAAPDLFADRDPEAADVKAALDARVLLQLPETDPAGRRVFVLRLGAAEPSAVPVSAVFKLNFMAADLMLLDDPAAVVCGAAILLDLEGASMAHVVQLSPTFVSRVMSILQDAYPLRTAAIHYVNAPWAVDVVMDLFKAALSGYLDTQFHPHADLTSLHSLLPPRILPTEYGGSAGSVQELADRYRRRIESHRQFFLDDAQFGVEEHLRPQSGAARPKAQRDAAMAAVAGSFRKLAVD